MGVALVDHLLVLNAGSSNLKVAGWTAGPAGWQPAFRDRIDGAGALASLLGRLDAGWPGGPVRAIGHRIVHGGDRPGPGVLATPGTIAELRRLEPLAPLHQPQALAALDACAQRFPGVPQVACFDTSFHAGHDEVATLVPLPADLRAAGIRRYGFHGLSCEFIAAELSRLAPDLATGRVVIAHLGSGASLCALRDGRSVDSSFGFTALDGLCMGTRPGALDPGVVLHLFQALGMNATEVEDLLYRRSGLLGISGLSADMRVLLASDEPAARLAVDYFVYRAARELGGLAAVLGGLDALVFTGGIGEHSAEIRQRIALASAWLGIRLDEAANARAACRISAAGSRVAVLVVPTDEEVVIARHAAALLGLGPVQSGVSA